MMKSPLNYTGGKYKLLPQLLPHFPKQINTFVDLFCGGCNVGINVFANHYIYNDSNSPLIGLYNTMAKLGRKDFISRIESIIDKYGLSDVKKYGYETYNCESSTGLSPYNKENYLKLRADFNQLERKNNDEYYTKLYVLIVYAFNNQIRFNSKGDFNLPCGKRDFNQKMYDKLGKFIDLINYQNAQFTNYDFTELPISILGESDMVYADPPYLITCAAYNEQNGWTTKDERNLLLLLDNLHERHVKFALSNVIEAKGKTNEILESWLSSRKEYKTIYLDYSYKNSNYQRKNKTSKTKEVLIINY